MKLACGRFDAHIGRWDGDCMENITGKKEKADERGDGKSRCLIVD
jgi:hypothetical protein